MKTIYWISLLLLVVFTACKKSSDDDNTEWTEEERTSYNNVLTLQDKAFENYTSWSQTMDSLDAIIALQQFFLSDPQVSSATIGVQGVMVQYANGMRGGVCLNPGDDPEEDTLKTGFIPKIPFSSGNEKSLVNLKKVIFINPHYWERGSYALKIIENYTTWLPKPGFTLQTIYMDQDATVDRFTELTGYGVVHIYSHGSPFPDEKNIEEVYLKTGEIANETTSKKYKNDIFNGNIQILERKSAPQTWRDIYHLSPKFIAAHNDFSKDTVLFYGGFCYSFLGGWDQLYQKFAKCSYFGFTWSVKTSKNTNWAISLVDSLCDTVSRPAYNPEKWITGPIIPKSYYDATDKRTVSIQYVGDATLTMWKSMEIETSPVTNITETNATGGGNIKSDGGLPVTARGICWSISPNPTIADDHTTDGSGTGIFTSNLTGLTSNKQYNVRAYATNSKGTFYGNQVSFTAGTSETVSDIDGNVYHTVKIGTQVWLLENLRVTHYNDGGAIAFINSSKNWYENGKVHGAAYCNYNDDPNNSISYGLLYNWYTIAGNVCPTGWHVPTNAEWTTLEEDIIGMVNAGGKMKEAGTAHWLSPNTGATNESGFTALPGGHRMWEGTSTQMGQASQWWSSTPSDGENSYFRQIFYDDTWIHGGATENERGQSIRCIKD